MIIMLRYVGIEFGHEKYPRLHVLWWIKIGFVHVCKPFYACNYKADFDVVIWSFCNVINELCIMVWLSIYV